MNSTAAQYFIRSVENVLYNWDQSSGVSSEQAMEAIKRAYETAYGLVPPAGTNSDK